MKHMISVLTAITFIVVLVFANVTISNKSNTSLVSLSFLMKSASAQSEIIDGTLYYVDEKLKTRLCVLPIGSQRLKCVSSEGDLCNPAHQTTCSGGALPF